MTPVHENDDAPHAAGPELGWSESYAFDLHDPASGLGGFTRIDVRPNQGVLEAALSFLLPDGGFITARHVRPETTSTAELEVEGLRFALVEPLRRWRIAYDGPAHSLASAREAGRRESWAKSRLERLIVELDFEALHAPGPEADAASGRFAQAGLLRGEVWVSGDQYVLCAPGIRARAWGPHEGDAPHMARLFHAAFGGDRALVVRRSSDGHDERCSGWIARDGRSVALRTVEIATRTEPDSYLQQGFTLTLGDAAGDEHRVEGEVVQLVPLPSSRGGRSLVECVATARFAWDGHVGHGLATYVHRLDANGGPVVAVT